MPLIGPEIRRIKARATRTTPMQLIRFLFRLVVGTSDMRTSAGRLFSRVSFNMMHEEYCLVRQNSC